MNSKGWFNQTAFLILHDIERLTVDSCNGTSEVEPYSTFKSKYAADLDIDWLVVQLPMLPNVVRTANTDQKLEIRKVPSVNTMCKIFGVFPFVLLLFHTSVETNLVWACRVNKVSKSVTVHPSL